MKEKPFKLPRTSGQFEDILRGTRSGWSGGDREFSIRVAVAVLDRLIKIEDGLDLLSATLGKVAKQTNGHKPKRKPTAWQEFFAAGMKAGKTPAQIGNEWRAKR